MRYYQIGTGPEDRRLAVETAEGTYDLTAASPEIGSFRDLQEIAAGAHLSAEELVERLLPDAPVLEDPSSLETTSQLAVRPDEVWAAGVTYRISEEAREAESDTPEMYLDVYDSERPEVFFKATPERTVGSNDDVGIRADSEWDVPEPELGVVLYRGSIVGYTVGNDVSSRSIEGDNPLYLPQAKVYDRSCSIGPCVRDAAAIEDPHDLEMSMEIRRDGTVLYEDATSTGEMVRSVEELVDYYTRHNAVPEHAVLLTGTALVPEDDFTLQEGDVVDIEIEEIGRLSNGVTVV